MLSQIISLDPHFLFYLIAQSIQSNEWCGQLGERRPLGSIMRLKPHNIFGAYRHCGLLRVAIEYVGV